MPKMIILRGIPGSGKTTFAKQLCKEEDYWRINYDELRQMILGELNWTKGFKLYKFESIIETISFELAKSIMTIGYDIVIDNTNLNHSVVNKWQNLGEEYGYEVEIKEMTTPLEICLERDKLRSTPVGEKVIRGMHERYYSH